MGSFLQFVRGNNDTELRLKYLTAASFIFLLLRPNTLHLKSGYVLFAFLALTSCYYLYAADTEEDSTFASETFTILDTLDPKHKYKFLYTDLNLLNVLNASLPLKTLNPQAFEQVVSSTNGLLKQEALIIHPSERHVQDLTAARDTGDRFAAEGIAQFHALIYSLPIEERAYNTLFQSCLDDYRVMVLNHQRRIYQLVADLTTDRVIDVKSPAVLKFGKPQPYTIDNDEVNEVVHFFKY